MAATTSTMVITEIITVTIFVRMAEVKALFIALDALDQSESLFAHSITLSLLDWSSCYCYLLAIICPKMIKK